MEARGNGKLLISGEYLVLKGAEALALPTRFGQEITALPSSDDQIKWFSYEKSTCFLEACFDLKGNAMANTDIKEVRTLAHILKAVLSLLQKEALPALTINATIEFNRNWGLGSSSSLIFCLSKVFKVDSFELLKLTFGGSGYDIACAQTNVPINYSIKQDKPNWQTVSFNPSFKDHIFFVYLNRKMNSKVAIAKFKEKLPKLRDSDIDFVSSITNKIIDTQSLGEFARLIELHEARLSEILEIPSVKEALFRDYPNAIKSLGAWGGDFILALGDATEMTYFRNKGYETILSFDEMILNNKPQ